MLLLSEDLIIYSNVNIYVNKLMLRFQTGTKTNSKTMERDPLQANEDNCYKKTLGNGHRFSEV